MNMMNNDVLRRIRYTFDFSDSEMIAMFNSIDLPASLPASLPADLPVRVSTQLPVTREQVSSWLKKDEDPNFRSCEDIYLSRFLNGFIEKKRGPKEGVPPKLENRLTNNVILRKIAIALNLKSDETLEILKLADFALSSHELSAFFRKPDHRHYRECKDQILRNFLKGLQLKWKEV